MVLQAWFMDDSDEDQRKPHQCDPPRPVSLEQLAKIGVMNFAIDVDAAGEYKKEGGALDKIKKERGYTYEDTITINRNTLPNYDEKMKMFFTEHLHTDEEIRLILDGVGYFDVRDCEDKWIRIRMEKGDMIVLPAGIYHRFTVDDADFIVANRLFVGEPVWTPHNRPADDMDARKLYCQSMQHKTEA